MPRNGSGVYNLPQPPFVPNTVISSAAVNSDLADIAEALTDSLAADGQTPLTGPLKELQGTLGAPSYTFTADNTAGLYLPGVGIVGLVVSNFGLLVNSTGSTATAATISSGGTGYVVNDTITLGGGTTLRATILKVLTVSSGAVTGVSIVDAGLYSATPGNPVGQGSTSGVGVGASFNITWDNTQGIFTDQAGHAIWQELGASAYMAGAMGLVDGAALANYIGASNIAAAVVSALSLPPPSGYLTLASSLNPILPFNLPDLTGSVLYYTPVKGLWNPIHNGTSLIPKELSGQLSITLTSSQAANDILDVYLIWNGGTPAIATSVSWSAGGGVIAPSGGSGTGCARGTGANSAALTTLHGFLVNAFTMSMIINPGGGNTTVTVPANQGVYLGTIYMDANAGFITCDTVWGQNRKWGIFNGYNRQPIVLKAGDSTSSWSATTGWRASNNVPATWSVNIYNVGSGTPVNGMVILDGLAQECVDMSFNQTVENSAAPGCLTGIGINEINKTEGAIGSAQITSGNANCVAHYISRPRMGIFTVNALENAAGATTFLGAESTMTLQAIWRG